MQTSGDAKLTRNTTVICMQKPSSLRMLYWRLIYDIGIEAEPQSWEVSIDVPPQNPPLPSPPRRPPQIQTRKADLSNSPDLLSAKKAPDAATAWR
jgi:hypothetical protein